MKRNILLFVITFLFASVTMAQKPYHPETAVMLKFVCEHVNTNSGQINRPRTPLQPPTAYIDDHTLFIYGGNRDFDLQILSDDGAVVYTTYVASGVNEVELPSSITGNVTLQLYYCDYIFESVITL